MKQQHQAPTSEPAAEGQFPAFSEWRVALATLPDEKLLEHTRLSATNEREHAAWLVAHLAEVYRRDLALKRGYSSVFKYAREELRLTDSQAWERVSAARLALQMPETVERLASGELSLSAAGELWKVIRDAENPALRTVAKDAEKNTRPDALSPTLLLMQSALPLLSQPPLGPGPERPPVKPPSLGEKRALLTQVLGKTRREAEAQLQGWKNERMGVGVQPCHVRPRSTSKQHGPWTEVAIHLNAAELERWNHLRDLLSHRLGSRDPQAVFVWLLSLGLEKIDPTRREERSQRRKNRAVKVDEAEQGAETAPAAPFLAKHVAPLREEAPRARRPLPASLKRRIWLRDQGRCQHVDPLTLRQCDATAFLDIDHRVPLSKGGGDEESSLALSCASHNRRRPRWAKEDQPTGSS